METWEQEELEAFVLHVSSGGGQRSLHVWVRERSQGSEIEHSGSALTQSRR